MTPETYIKRPDFNSHISVNRVKSVKRSESLLSRFSFIFPQETEKLADILVEEFKKNDQSNGLAMERMFRKADPSALVEVNGFNIFIKPHLSPVLVLWSFCRVLSELGYIGHF